MSAGDTLSARVEELGRASRRAAFLSLFGLLTVLAALAYGTVRLGEVERQRRILAVDVTSLDSERTLLQREIDQDKKDIAALDAWKEGLARANEGLAATVRSAAPTLAGRSALQRADNAKYAVGLYAFGVNRDQYELATKRLEDDGYVITQTGLFTESPPPDWLSRHSSVLYYDNAAASKARGIADTLSRLTGTKFAIARGAGLGVVSGQARWTFFIHYIGR
jgi:hypothetical protein